MAGNMLAQNAYAREQMLSTAIRSCQMLPTQAWTVGARRSFELNSAGILRYLLVSFTGTLTLGAGAAPTWSPKAPYNIFSLAEFKDVAGTTRVSASPFMLQTLTNLNKFGFTERFTDIAYGLTPLRYNLPSIAGGAGAYPVVFNFVIPVAYDEDDPRGAMVLAVPNAKAYTELTCNASLNGTTPDSVTIGGAAATTVLTGTITVTQHYFDPEARGGAIALPTLDLAQIHEIREVASSSNLTAGMEKLFSLTTGRVYHAGIIQFVNGATGMDTVDIARLRYLYNGNTPTLDELLQQYLWRTHAVYGRDVGDGLFPYDWRKRPWDSNIWGQLQLGITPANGAVIAAGAYMSLTTKSLYTAQQNLGGAGQ